MEPEKVRAAPAILNAGAVAGAMDIAAASIQAWIAGRTPMRMLQGIAIGWFGRPSLQMGWTSAAVNVGCSGFGRTRCHHPVMATATAATNGTSNSRCACQRVCGRRMSIIRAFASAIENQTSRNVTP